MQKEQSQIERVVGMDMHPDIFTAAVMEGKDAGSAKVGALYDGIATERLEEWAKKHLGPLDLVVLEASGNSFEVVKRLKRVGVAAVVIESQRAGQIRKAYCNTDKLSAVKLGRVYLSGLAREVWTPDEQTRERREVLHSHRKAVTTCTRLRNRIRGFLNEHGKRAPRGTPLAQPKGRGWVLRCRAWTAVQQMLLEQMFEELWAAEKRRKQLRALMAREVLEDPELLPLVRLMGVRHIVAYGIGAVIGDIHRFANPKKLVAYLGLTPNRDRSGLTINRDGGLVPFGRKDLRSLLIQSAQNAMNQKKSPLHRWGWKLNLRKGHRNIAVAAVARKLTVSIWYLLKGRFTPLTEVSQTIRVKIHKLATEIGVKTIKAMGYRSKKAFEEEKFAFLLNSA
jgi:transposase